jgi:hypothetical protein
MDMFDSCVSKVYPIKKVVRLGLAPASAYTPTARLRVEQPARIAGIGEFRPVGQWTMQRGTFDVPLASGTSWVDLSLAPF